MIPDRLRNFLYPPATSPSQSTQHSVVAAEPLIADPPSSPSAFEKLLASEDLPPPGPDHFHARRALWLTPLSVPRPPSPPSASEAHTRLEELLNKPGALENNDVWQAGLGKVWKSLVSGGRLKQLLPLKLVIKILYAGWLRDGTWPENAAAVETDDFFSPAHVYPHPHSPALGYGDAGRLSSGAPSDSTSAAVRNGSIIQH
ncbi:hypothetical protein HETIRDRAFT_449454 [Heterobasidion irregulare TC 32-1]|uniref:Uncharacterized protein n=1 Tax=Heterobasidion irregulare (strain TC 32-1) TaxID=747525 RepID=W4KEU8_HETIT|nr:uncharacterized protein HETIRDRAFT_449454 [Heterobasidion irregulare TC 32-1]ETW83825.1 hypothetical protein HETIRDRAFT_449454 [Heterobasidion irregulare TC 32-1]